MHWMAAKIEADCLILAPLLLMQAECTAVPCFFRGLAPNKAFENMSRHKTQGEQDEHCSLSV